MKLTFYSVCQFLILSYSASFETNQPPNRHKKETKGGGGGGKTNLTLSLEVGLRRGNRSHLGLFV